MCKLLRKRNNVRILALAPEGARGIETRPLMATRGYAPGGLHLPPKAPGGLKLPVEDCRVQLLP